MTGIRVIKFYAWEKHFTSKIFELRYICYSISTLYYYTDFHMNSHRQRELKSLRGRKYLDALCVYFWATTPVLISILTFTTYVALGNHLTAAKVRPMLSLCFSMLEVVNDGGVCAGVLL